ncbi:hypothetical protein EV2_015616 [Malus domestica]
MYVCKNLRSFITYVDLRRVQGRIQLKCTISLCKGFACVIVLHFFRVWQFDLVRPRHFIRTEPADDPRFGSGRN